MNVFVPFQPKNQLNQKSDTQIHIYFVFLILLDSAGFTSYVFRKCWLSLKVCMARLIKIQQVKEGGRRPVQISKCYLCVLH